MRGYERAFDFLWGCYFGMLFPKLDHFRELVSVIIVTRGFNGSSVYLKHQEFHIAAYKTKEIDPTGAGYVFGTAFILKQITSPEKKMRLFCSVSLQRSAFGFLWGGYLFYNASGLFLLSLPNPCR